MLVAANDVDGSGHQSAPEEDIVVWVYGDDGRT